MTIKKIVSRISKDLNNCWIWNGSQTGDGHGNVRIKGKNRYIHKVVYESFNGPVPDDLELHHICEVKHCCNPNHLKAVTRREHLLLRPKMAYCRRGHSYEKDGYYKDCNGGKICKKCQRENRLKRERTR